MPKINSQNAPDPELEKVILKTLGDYNPQSPSDEVRYYYNRVDLNGDGNLEAIVHLVGQSICGTGGCNTLIFQPARLGYRLVSSISVTNTPIIVSTHRTNGWSDLILYVSGGGLPRGHYVALAFDGRTYPDNPTILPALGARTKINGKAYLSDDVSPRTGITLRPAKE